MAEEQTSQTIEKPANAAPVEPNIDNLLPNIPAFKELFTEETPKAVGPEQKDSAAPAPEPGAQETVPLEDVIPEGLKPEGEKPLEEGKKEESLSESVQKRIDKLTAQRKTAEERAQALESELSELKSKYQAPPPIQPTAADPLADIESKIALETKVKHIQEAKDWCLRHRNGGEVSDGKGGKIWLDEATVTETYANAERMLSVEAPKKAKFLSDKEIYDAEARREYPALFKKGTEPQKIYDQWCTVFPEARRYADLALIVGDALVGQQIRLNRAKTRNGHSPSAQAPPLAPPAPAASPRVPQTNALSGQALRDAFAQDPRAALDSFVDSLIDGGAAQRAAKKT